jgi:arylsulfatase A-like enzyme
VQISALAPERAEDVSQTSLARLFAAACEQLQSAAAAGESATDGPRLVWVHARGLYGPWDAPLELQESLLEHDEGDPEVCESLESPDVTLDESAEPDAAFRWSCGYAAQVMVLDACIEGLLAAIQEAHLPGQWLVVLIGVRGFPLGEHGRIGGVDERLFVEQLHVPMLWRFPDGTGRLARSGELTSHLDVLPTLLDQDSGVAEELPPGGCGVSLLPLIRQTGTPVRDALIAASSMGQRSVRTAEWSLRCEPISGRSDASASPRRSADEGARRELYVRPDDRWEANDIAALCREVVQELTKRLDQATER